MRDRLIELLKQNCHCKDEDCSKCSSNGICFSHREADYLLENGVIVPPCKKGDTIYVILYAPISRRHHIKETIAGNVHSINAHWYVECHETIRPFAFGERAFVNKEDAEQALSKLQASYEQVKEGGQE